MNITYKASLYIGKELIDYMIFDSEDLEKAGAYTDERFDRAYPQYSNKDNVHITITEIQKGE